MADPAAGLAALGAIAVTVIGVARRIERAQRRRTTPPAPRLRRPPVQPAIDPARAPALAGLDTLLRAVRTGSVTHTQYEEGVAALLSTLPGTPRDTPLRRQAIRDSTHPDLRVSKPAVHYLLGHATADTYWQARTATGLPVEPEDAIPPGYEQR
jgi:hypothetical protein